MSVLIVVATLLLAACSGDDAPAREMTPQPFVGDFAVGRPQARTGIGDVDRVFERYRDTRADLIDLFRSQPWFKDGLTRDESLFVERAITFVASYEGPRRYAYVSEATISRKLYRYEKLSLSQGKLEILLIFQPGDDGDREMLMLKQIATALEKVVGVQYPESVMVVINGDFEINDFNDGQFIRIAECCTLSAFVLAHEMAHTYWSMGPPWFNEGMADVYSILVQQALNESRPEGWKQTPADLDGHYRSRKILLDSGRYPDMLLPRRLASDGLYEAADVFLLDIRRILGDSAFADASREIYLASDFGRYTLRDKRIEDVYLKYAREETHPELMALFNRLIWGDNGESYQRLKELEGS